MTMSCYVYFFGYLVSFQECISIRCVPHFSNKNKYLFRKSFYRLVIIDLMLLMISILCFLFADKILIGLNVDVKLAKATHLLLLKTLPAKIIENLNNLLKGLLISQNYFKDFHMFNFASLSVFSLCIYITMAVYGLELDGYVISFTVKVIAESILLLTYILFKIDKDYLSLPSLKELKEGFLNEIVFVATIIFTTYIEMIAFFIAFIILAQTKNNKMLAAYSIFTDLVNYFYYFQLGYTTYIRTQLLLAVGEGNNQNYKRVRRIMLCYSVVSLSFIVVIWFFSFKYLIRLYLNDRVTIEYVNIMSFLQTGTFILEHFVILFSAFMKIIGTNARRDSGKIVIRRRTASSYYTLLAACI